MGNNFIRWFPRLHLLSSPLSNFPRTLLVLLLSWSSSLIITIFFHFLVSLLPNFLLPFLIPFILLFFFFLLFVPHHLFLIHFLLLFYLLLLLQLGHADSYFNFVTWMENLVHYWCEDLRTSWISSPNGWQEKGKPVVIFFFLLTVRRAAVVIRRTVIAVTVNEYINSKIALLKWPKQPLHDGKSNYCSYWKQSTSGL